MRRTIETSATTFMILAAVVLVGWTFFAPQAASAIQWLTFRVCRPGLVTIEGYTSQTISCWMVTGSMETYDRFAPPLYPDYPLPWGDWHPPYSAPPPRPDTACVLGLANKYGHYKQQDASIVYERRWGFATTSEPKRYYWSGKSSRPPADYQWLLGLTWNYPGPMEAATVHIYWAAYSRLWNQLAARLPYTDPTTGLNATLRGPIRPDEMLLIVLVHEFGHASSSGLSENKLTGWGVQALKAYRNDPNATSCL